MAFDLATHRGYDSDHPRVTGDVGKAGVAIDSVEDMKILFDQIPLDKVSVSMTMNGAVLPVLAGYVVAAEEQGVAQDKLSGTIQNDILKEFMVRNTYIFPPQPSMRIIGDIIEYTAQKMPKFNSIWISGYHMQEAGANQALELAFTLADGKEYVKTALAKGLDVDEFAGRLSFFWAIGMNFYLEVAKMRAARLLWCRIMKELRRQEPQEPDAAHALPDLRLEPDRAGPATTTWCAPPSRPWPRCSAARRACTPTRSTKRSRCPPSSAARIARNTQLIIQEETHITNVIDPWAGSYMMEKLTQDMADAAWAIIEEVEAMGGMTKAVDSGWAKLKIEAAAAEKQARIDPRPGRRSSASTSTSSRPKTRSEHPRGRQRQGARRPDRAGSRPSRASRDSARPCRPRSTRSTAAAESGDGNLLDTEHQGRAPARHRRRDQRRAREGLRPPPRRYAEGHRRLRRRLRLGRRLGGAGSIEIDAQFAEEQGRRPRVMISKLGQDGHDRGAKVVATAFADLGFDVDMGPLFQTPEECARQAIENDVHAVGVSTLAAGHKTLVPAIIAELRKQGADDIIVFVGGVIPRQDYDFLYEAGVKGIYGPGTPIPASAKDVLEQIRAACSLRRCGPPRHRSRWTALLADDGPAQRRAIAKAITLLESTRADHRTQADELLTRLLPHTGQLVPARHLGRAGRRQVDLHRNAGPVPDRQGPPRGGAHHRPVVHRLGRLHPRRQDAHGTAVGARARLHPAQPLERHAGRRGREDARGHAGVRGGRLRHRDRRDRRRRPERDRRRRHDRHVRAACSCPMPATTCRRSRRA